MSVHTIAPTPCLSAKAVASFYFGAFGALWLFIEPLSFFGLLPQLSKFSGAVIYLVLLLVPAVMLLVFLRWFRWHKTHHLPFVQIAIRSALDGATYQVRVAENMQVGEVLTRFLEILLKGPAQHQVKDLSRRFYPVLQVRRNDQFIDVHSNQTINMVGLKNHDECQVRAQLYEHFSGVMFSLSKRASDVGKQ